MESAAPQGAKTRQGVRTHGVAPWAFDPAQFHARPYGIAAAKRYCRNLAARHYENFPVAFSLFTKEQREAIYAIYAFARTADDFADEPEYAQMGGRLLDDWEEQLCRCYGQNATHPVMIALAEAVSRFELDKQLFIDLIDAFRQDMVQARYESFDELLDYCRRSANPVGRLLLRVLGCESSSTVGWSDNICTALQLANFWQDVSVDAGKGRIYIPRQDLKRFRVSERSILSGTNVPGLDALVRFEVRRTTELLKAGRPLLGRTGFPAACYFTAVWIGGRTVLRLVHERGAEVLTTRPRITLGSFTRAVTGAGIARMTGGRR